MRKLGSVFAALFGAIIVVDGDTVQLDGKRYRLLGFDAPETFWAKCANERQRGRAATERLRRLIETREATLEPTGRNCKWRRECAYLFVGGQDVAEIMIHEGYARPYDGGRRENWCN